MKVLIGVVSGEYIRAKTVNTLLDLERRYGYDWVIKQGVLVQKNREDIVVDALKKDYTHLFFVDSDMCFDARVLGRLLEDDKDIVGVMYKTRDLTDDTTVKLLPDTGILDHLFKCSAVGAGCMLIKMSVFKKLDRPYFFIEDKGEDVYFCDKARAKGIDVWCDPTVAVGHIGEYIY